MGCSMHECRDPAHMGTPQASGHGGPVRACVHRPGARMHGDPVCERAWGPGASMCAGPGACVHGNQVGVGARCKRACVRGDPASEQAWGPGVCLHRDRAGVGTRCERARWALGASRCGDLVQASVRGPSACVRGPSACVDPAGTDRGVRESSRHGHGRAGIRQGRCRHPACQEAFSM